MTLCGASGTSTSESKPRIRWLLGKKISLVAIALVLAGVCLKNRLLFEASHERIYQEYRLIIKQTYELAERRASDAEWAAFEQESQQRLAPIAALSVAVRR